MISIEGAPTPRFVRRHAVGGAPGRVSPRDHGTTADEDSPKGLPYKSQARPVSPRGQIRPYCVDAGLACCRYTIGFSTVVVE